PDLHQLSHAGVRHRVFTACSGPVDALSLDGHCRRDRPVSLRFRGSPLSRTLFGHDDTITYHFQSGQSRGVDLEPIDACTAVRRHLRHDPCDGRSALAGSAILAGAIGWRLNLSSDSAEAIAAG